MAKELSSEKQPWQPGDNPRFIKVPGSNRIYDRNRILLVVLVPLMMALLQVSSVDTALTAIDDALHASASQLQWVLSGYALAIGIFLVPAGRLGDIFGRSGAFVTGLAIFALASLLIGVMHDATWVNIFRVLQGIGAGIFSPQSNGIIQQYFEGRARAKAFALFGLVVSMSVAAGPLLSGSLISWLGDDLGWRSAFIVNFPLGVIGLVFAFLWLPFGKERRTIGAHKDEVEAEFEAAQKAQGRRFVPRTGQHIKIDLDPVGLLILVIGVLGIMLPFMLNTVGPWKWSLVAGGVVFVGIFVAWERHYKQAGHFPMVDLSLFEITTFSYSTAISFVQFLGTTSIFAILALFLQKGLGVNALTAALVMLTSAAMSAVMAIVAGRRAYDKGPEIQVFALISMLVAIVGFIAATWAVSQGASYWLLAIPAAFLGIGQGSIGTANQTLAMLDVPPSHGGTAGGIIQTGQRIATAIGTAIITAVFWNHVNAVPGDITGFYRGVYWANALVAVFLVVAFIFAAVFLIHIRNGRSSGTPATH